MKFENITDRELSWLSFDQRVLELAEDSRIPLLERVRFLAIFSSNLDEFFMVRVATLMSKLENNITDANVAGITPQDLMQEISTRTRALVDRQSDVFHKDILVKLKNEGIEFVHWDDL
ncbi:MAG: RNA degradosome polyphosphate kinase, partial [Actinobacteria bacterium]|nr:RNA degradosome polyphosphate kinase [Actinomycetota bacterium]